MSNQGKITIEQPGEEIEGVLPTAVLDAMMKPDAIALLWSPWGLEGVYEDTTILSQDVTSLRKLSAYRDERITVEVRQINSSL